MKKPDKKTVRITIQETLLDAAKKFPKKIRHVEEWWHEINSIRQKIFYIHDVDESEEDLIAEYNQMLTWIKEYLLEYPHTLDDLKKYICEMYESVKNELKSLNLPGVTEMLEFVPKNYDDIINYKPIVKGKTNG